jgi:L-histidine N-alpha-methyltransferase
MLTEAAAGLRAPTKVLPPVWFYDDAGSQLFDEITRLDEYYPTRAERALLEVHAEEIARITDASTLLELGAGTCEKSRILIDALRRHGSLTTYVPLDVSAETIERASLELVAEFPGLDVHAMVADFLHHLGSLPSGTPRLVAFLGGTIGNLDPAGRRRFYADLDASLDSTDWLLLGCDLVKDPARLVAAYDDARGVTAEFNRNALRVLNHELGATFDPERFEHVALFDAEHEWIEMRLRSIGDQTVLLPGLDLEISFVDGEELHTEISAKFTTERLRSELEQAGFVIDAMWDQPGGDFLLTLAHPYC